MYLSLIKADPNFSFIKGFKMTARTQTADLLKGIAVLLMIQVHIIELFASQDIYNSGWGSILLFLGGPPVAPIFTIIFGYFIASSKRSALQLISRGLKIICIGFLLNIALNFNLIISVSKGVYQIDLLPYIFGVDILPFAGISIIVIALLKNIIEKSLIFVIACIIVSAFLGQFLLDFVPQNINLKYISAFFYGSAKWSYFPLFPWLAYPLAGIAFYKLKQRYDFNFLHTAKIKIAAAILFLMFLIFTINYAVNVSSDLPLYYHHGILFVLWVILFLCFYSFFMSGIDKLLGETFVLKYIKWLGENVTAVYIIQWIIIGNTATEIYKTISSPMNLLFSFFSALVSASLVCYLWLWIKEKLNKKPA